MWKICYPDPGFMHLVTDCLISSLQVLGYYNRRGINPEAFLNEIKYIASDPDDKHFFNVTDESALKDIVDALGERIFSLEGFTRYFIFFEAELRAEARTEALTTLMVSLFLCHSILRLIMKQ